MMLIFDVAIVDQILLKFVIDAVSTSMMNDDYVVLVLRD